MRTASGVEIPDEAIEDAARRALDAFWHRLHTRFPGTHPLHDRVDWDEYLDELRVAATNRVRTWLHWGTPSERPAPDLQAVVERAIEAFWDEVSAAYPDITSGDLDPWTVHMFATTAENAVDAWLIGNTPLTDEEETDEDVHP